MLCEHNNQKLENKKIQNEIVLEKLNFLIEEFQKIAEKKRLTNLKYHDKIMLEK